MEIQQSPPVEAPDPDEVVEVIEAVDQLIDEVAHYRAVAKRIDYEIERRNEDRYLSLDELPFGEELIRTEKLPGKLAHAAHMLAEIVQGVTPILQAAENFERVQAIVDDTRSTLDDCTSLPPDDDDDE